MVGVVCIFFKMGFWVWFNSKNWTFEKYFQGERLYLRVGRHTLEDMVIIIKHYLLLHKEILLILFRYPKKVSKVSK